MCLLKGFRRFVVIFHVQNGLIFVFESFSFEHHCVEESNEICMKILTNDTAILVPMVHGSMCLEVVLSIELEQIFVQDETKHFSKKLCWDRWILFIPSS